MKTLLTVLFTVAMSVTAQAKYSAIDANSSWEDILNSGLQVDAPAVQFGMTFKKVLDVCVKGDYLFATVPQCVEYSGTGDNYHCSKYEDVAASTPITYQKEICNVWSNDDCRGTETVTRTIALSYNFEVYRETGDSHRTVAFTKRFDIPACQ